jgi:hypothetical protein
MTPDIANCLIGIKITLGSKLHNEKKKMFLGSWVWWHTSIIPVLRAKRQEAHEFKASLD